MKIIDLVDEFVSNESYRRDYSLYERLYPQLFEHYFTYFSSRGYLPPKAAISAILRGRFCILAELPTIEAAFESAGLSLDNLEIVLFAGVAGSNGHAMREGDRFAVWLPVETYPTPLAARVFVTHEIAHALHYASCPEFYFDSFDAMQHFGRLLITEGMATHTTRAVLGVSRGTAHWADFLSPELAKCWQEQCQAEQQRLACFALEHFETSIHREFFQANEPADIRQNRAGYYLGLKVVELLAETQGKTLAELLVLERKVTEGQARRILRQISLRS